MLVNSFWGGGSINKIKKKNKIKYIPKNKNKNKKSKNPKPTAKKKRPNLQPPCFHTLQIKPTFLASQTQKSMKYKSVRN